MPQTGVELTVLLARPSYIRRVQSILGSAVIGYWPLSESSGSVANDASGNSRSATYNAVVLANTPGPGIALGAAPSFDGAASQLNFPAGTLTSLNAGGVFKPTEGALMAWVKMVDAAHWANASQYAIAQFSADGNNKFTLLKDAANRISANFVVGANFTTPNTPRSALDWFHIGMTWSSSLNKMRFFVNGAQVGGDNSYTGTWAGSLASAETHIGSGNGSAFWPGWLAHAILTNQLVTAGQFALLGTPA